MPTALAALRLGELALKQLGFTAWRAKQAAHRFRGHNIETLNELRKHYHEDIGTRARISADARERLRELMRDDENQIAGTVDKDWRSHSDESS